MTFGSHLLPPHPQFIGEPGKRYAVVAGVMRPTGGVWAQIGGDHKSVNLTAITQTATGVVIDYSAIGAKDVVSFYAVPDETWAGKYACGASVGLAQATVEIKQDLPLGVLLQYSGSAWSVSSSNRGSFTVGTYSSGLLTLNHSTVNAAAMVQLTSLKGVLVPFVDGAGADYIRLGFKDWAGTTITTPTTDMKCYVSRLPTDDPLDPSTIGSEGNIWFGGVFEV